VECSCESSGGEAGEAANGGGDVGRDDARGGRVVAANACVKVFSEGEVAVGAEYLASPGVWEPAVVRQAKWQVGGVEFPGGMTPQKSLVVDAES
jgi:hypothetical protein